jgi:hypothetical protein
MPADRPGRIPGQNPAKPFGTQRAFSFPRTRMTLVPNQEDVAHSRCIRCARHPSPQPSYESAPGDVTRHYQAPGSAQKRAGSRANEPFARGSEPAARAADGQVGRVSRPIRTIAGCAVRIAAYMTVPAITRRPKVEAGTLRHPRETPKRRNSTFVRFPGTRFRRFREAAQDRDLVRHEYSIHGDARSVRGVAWEYYVGGRLRSGINRICRYTPNCEYRPIRRGASGGMLVREW